MDRFLILPDVDFALTTDMLDFMQKAYTYLENISAVGGANYILKGGDVNGSVADPGVIVINGEVMPFTGGSVQTNVRIITVESNITVGIAQRKQRTRYAEFGTSTNPAENTPWADFVKTDTIIELMNRIDVLEVLVDANETDIADLDSRIDLLETDTGWLQCTIDDAEVGDTISQVRKRGNVVTCSFAFRRPAGSTGTGVLEGISLPAQIPAPSGTFSQIGIYFSANGDQANGQIRCTVLENGKIRIFQIENMVPGAYYHGCVSYVV